MYGNFHLRTSLFSFKRDRFPSFHPSRCLLLVRHILPTSVSLVFHSVSPSFGLVNLLALSNFQARCRSSRALSFTGHSASFFLNSYEYALSLQVSWTQWLLCAVRSLAWPLMMNGFVFSQHRICPFCIRASSCNLWEKDPIQGLLQLLWTHSWILFYWCLTWDPWYLSSFQLHDPSRHCKKASCAIPAEATCLVKSQVRKFIQQILNLLPNMTNFEATTFSLCINFAVKISIAAS